MVAATLLIPLLLLPQRAFAQSDERIADTGRRTAGGHPRATLAIFESINNPQHIAAFNFAALTYYIAPLFVLETAAPLNPVRTPEGDLLYGFDLIAYTDRAVTDAAAYLSRTITDTRNNQFVTIQPNNISFLPHQMVQLFLREQGGGGSAVEIQRIGANLDQNVSLNPVNRITIRVPADRQEFFESLVRSGNLEVEAALTYNARSVVRVQLQVSEASIVTAAQRIAFAGGGAAYFNADDLQQIVREAATTTDVNIFIDPLADAEMVAWVTQFFDTLLAQNFATTAESLAEAAKLEAKLWEGPGIQPADFQPITLLWNITRNLATIDDYRQANESVRDYYDMNKTSFSVSFKAGWGPFSATIKQGFDRLTINREFFSSQEELNQFKQENLKENGQEPRITARGLNLVSFRELESRVIALARVVAVKPKDRINNVLLRCPVVYEGSDSTDVPNMVDIQRRLVALEKQEIKSTSIGFNSDAQTEFDVLVTPYRPDHAKRPIAEALHPQLVASYVTGASVERRNNGRMRAVELTIKWPRPFAEGTTVNAFAAFRMLDVDGNGGSENTRVDVSVGSVDHAGLVIHVQTWEGTYLYGLAIWVVAYSSAGADAVQNLFPLDAAAAEIAASTTQQQVYNLYRPQVLLEGIQSSPTLQRQHGLYPLSSAAANFLASPALLDSYGFKQRVVDLVRSNAVEMAAAGLYPESAIRNLHADAPLIAVNPATGRAEIELGLQYSDSLEPNSWQPFGDAVIWTDQARPDHAFYRVFLNERPEAGAD